MKTTQRFALKVTRTSTGEVRFFGEAIDGRVRVYTAKNAQHMAASLQATLKQTHVVELVATDAAKHPQHDA